jgi:hypothetical protein
VQCEIKVFENKNDKHKFLTMKKVIILIAGYLIIGVTIATMQSCFLSYDGWIVDVVFKGNYRSNEPDIDDLTKSIDFQIIAGGSDLSHRFAYIKNVDLFSKCYATTKCAKWQNYLDISSFSVTFDRGFLNDTDTIESGIDILKIESIRRDIAIDKDNDECKFIFYTMTFSSELKNRLTFESGEYTVYFSCKTTDGKEFNKSRKVIFYQD